MQNPIFDMLRFIDTHTEDRTAFNASLPDMTEKDVRDTYHLLLTKSYDDKYRNIS